MQEHVAHKEEKELKCIEKKYEANNTLTFAAVADTFVILFL